MDYIPKIYGISQNPDTKDYIMVHDVYCNEKIVKLVKEMQAQTTKSKMSDNVFEWIPYNQFYNFEEIGKELFASIHSATWWDGPLYFYTGNNMQYLRSSGKKVTLKCLHNSQNITNEFLNEV